MYNVIDGLKNNLITPAHSLSLIDIFIIIKHMIHSHRAYDVCMLKN